MVNARLYEDNSGGLHLFTEDGYSYYSNDPVATADLIQQIAAGAEPIGEGWEGNDEDAHEDPIAGHAETHLVCDVADGKIQEGSPYVGHAGRKVCEALGLTAHLAA